MKKYLRKLSLCFLAVIFSSQVEAKEVAQYPQVSGRVLFELKPDHLTSNNKSGIADSNVLVNIEPDFALNLNKNWAIKTGWRIFPTLPRDSVNPERSRTILNKDYRSSINIDDSGVIVEEIKTEFQSEDMKFSAGKYNPTFGTMHRKNKRIGVFNTDFTEDYELREKIGANVAALLENSEITFNGFFNDTSSLSESAINNNRRKAQKSDGIAGNTGSSLSSYSVTMEGKELFGVKNLFYNVGYRSLGVRGGDNSQRETGEVAGLEYLIKTRNNISITPLIEAVKLDNFTGERGRKTKYVNLAVVTKYSSWVASISTVMRDTKHSEIAQNNKDHLTQLSVGYKFTNNLSVDLSRANLKEDGYSAVLLGGMLSYVYNF